MQNTRTPRVQITLKPETRAIFARLSAAQDRPEATVIAEFLEETAPVLSNVVTVVERAKNAIQKAGMKERQSYAVAEAQLLQHQHTALSALAGFDATMTQLGLDLDPVHTKARKAAVPGASSTRKGRLPVARRSDPLDTNRGVNKGGKGNGKRSTK